MQTFAEASALEMKSHSTLYAIPLISTFRRRKVIKEEKVEI